ncbi:glucokinase [Mesorhizobium sp. M0644]|uniref:glucokinase n=1 Tax=unclassified Mesorhizobium TaxID=325217 RepID=UPI0003CF6DBB|nr:glucokinase [Mesorhizobium sp. LSJC280B00]ESW79822.1 glucokinase [Mesorhizobium sp. LSJC280B00]
MPGVSDDDTLLRFPILIGDIGGTNARFSIVLDANSEAGEPTIVQTANFNTIDEAIQAAVLDRSSVRPNSAVLAVAGPVESDEIPLTNCPWIVKPRQMFASLGLSDVVVLNDFEAQALAVVALGEEHMEKIGGDEPEPNSGRVVLGPGTGLGVAGLVYALHHWIPVPGEGGHMDIGPRSPRDFQVFPHIEKLEGRISGEQILSGRGLVNAYRAVAKADGKPSPFTTPAEVTAAALAKNDPVAEEALSIFVTCLGRTAGDLALVFMSRGGVFLTGGIAQKILPALRIGNFRAAFEDKAPHSALMRSMPVYVITHPLAALLGLAAYARNPSLFGVQTAGRRWRV